MSRTRADGNPLQGEPLVRQDALSPSAWASLCLQIPLKVPAVAKTTAGPLAADLKQPKLSEAQTLQATLAWVLHATAVTAAVAQPEQKAKLPTACSLPQSSPSFRIAAFQPQQPATPAPAAETCPAPPAAPALPERPQLQQTASTAQRTLEHCARLLTSQRQQKPLTPEQQLAEQVLAIVQAAAASQPIPAEQPSEALTQAVAAWYVDNILQEPNAFIKHG